MKNIKKQGTLVQYINSNKQKNIWMVTDDPTKGVVVYSDDLLALGTITELTNYQTESFVGGVQLKSTPDS